MAVRTTEDRVIAVIQRDYDLRNQPSLATFINSASLIVDRTVACAARKGITITDAEALEMETWVAGYRYTHNNPVYSSKSTDGRSASFLREGGENPYKKGALELDPSGCLDALLDPKKKVRLGLTWLGKRPTEAIDFDDRR
jgi:hypothetical protein